MMNSQYTIIITESTDCFKCRRRDSKTDHSLKHVQGEKERYKIINENRLQCKILDINLYQLTTTTKKSIPKSCCYFNFYLEKEKKKNYLRNPMKNAKTIKFQCFVVNLFRIVFILSKTKFKIKKYNKQEKKFEITSFVFANIMT